MVGINVRPTQEDHDDGWTAEDMAAADANHAREESAAEAAAGGTQFGMVLAMATRARSRAAFELGEFTNSSSAANSDGAAAMR